MRPWNAPMRPPVLWLVFFTVSACSTEGGSSPTATRSDSLGIEVVSSEAAAWDAGGAWRLEPTPLVTIGQMSGEDPYLLGDVGGAIRIGHRLIVADRQAQELRVFDVGGQFIETLGSDGEGPGEFSGLYRLHRCDRNRIYADDRRDQTVQVRDSAGTLLREVRVIEPGQERPTAPYRLECSGQDDGFIAAGWGDGGQEREQGFVLQWMGPVFVLDEDGEVVRELGEYLTAERFARYSPGGGGTIAPHPFGRAVSFALGSDEVYLGTGDGFEVEVHERSTGEVRRIMRGPQADLTVPETALAEYGDADLTEDEERLRSLLLEGGSPMPEALPAFTDMRLDDSGHLWVRRFSPPGTREERWGVFAPDGAFLGHVELPPSHALTDIGDDWIVTVSLDDLHVQKVHLYELDRAGAD